MVELSRWAANALKDYQANKIKAEFTVEEFQNKVKKIPQGIDFSKMAKDWVHSKPSAHQEVPSTNTKTDAALIRQAKEIAKSVHWLESYRITTGMCEVWIGENRKKGRFD